MTPPLAVCRFDHEPAHAIMITKAHYQPDPIPAGLRVVQLSRASPLPFWRGTSLPVPCRIQVRVLAIVYSRGCCDRKGCERTSANVIGPSRGSLIDYLSSRQEPRLARRFASSSTRLKNRLSCVKVVRSCEINSPSSLAHLEDLRTEMRKRGLSEKTIRNVIDASFRVMVRYAERDDLTVSFPFPKMRWPEEIVPGPSPFTEEERDKILGYFRAKRWKVGGLTTPARTTRTSLSCTLYSSLACDLRN